jgi:microcystin-dependent protein
MAEPFLGEIRVFSFNFPPRGWSLCQGQTLPIAQNQALFSLLGTSYGGDGRITFQLPNLQGRTPVNSTNPGNLGGVGLQYGVETVTLSAGQLPAHGHTLLASTTAASTNAPLSSATPPVPNALGAASIYVPNVPPVSLVPMNVACLGSTGGAQPHNNMQPSLVLNYCIALSGIYPSRS